MSELCKLGEIAKPNVEISIIVLMRSYLIIRFENAQFEVSSLMKFALAHKPWNVCSLRIIWGTPPN
jgi:hypothetical protein